MINDSEKANTDPESFMILISGGSLCEGMGPLLLSRARKAWADRTDKHVANINLGDMSVPANIVAEVRSLPRSSKPMEPKDFSVLVAGDWSPAGRHAVTQLLTEIGRAITNGKPFVIEPLQKFDEHMCRLAQVTNSEGSRWVGWALIGDATHDDDAGLSMVSVAAIVFEEEARNFIGPPDQDKAVCIPMVVLRPTELPFGTRLPDPMNPENEAIVVAYDGNDFVLILHDETTFDAQPGDLVFRNVTMNGLTGNSLLAVHEDGDGPKEGPSS